MGKRSRPTVPLESEATPGDAGRARKRLKRLERKLARLRATEAKRREQLNEVRARAADVRTQLTTLIAIVADATPASRSDAAGGGPIGFCMREKRPVQIKHPNPVTLSNGRAAIAGTCPTCGARVMVLSARVVPTDA